MGGIDVDVNGRTSIDGLFACGECACVSVHGANRLGGNSLLETLVFGKLVGQAVDDFNTSGAQDPSSQHVADTAKKLSQNIDRLEDGKHLASELRDQMNSALMDGAGVFRNEQDLSSLREELRQLTEDARNIKLRHHSARFNGGLITALELPLMLEVAAIIVEGALARTESRGSHFRTDHPKRDDANWLKHTIATKAPDGPQLTYSDVDLSLYEPKERTY